MVDLNDESSIDAANASDDTLERLRNITKMFSVKVNEEDDHQQLQKVEKFAPSAKIKNTFQRFEELGSSIDQYDDDEVDTTSTESNGINRLTRKKKTPKEHIPYHEMAEVKDKFEKGLVDVNKPRVEKRLDVRVQSGLTSSKKQAFEQGEFEQEVDPHVNKTQIETDLVAGLTSSKKQVFEQQTNENMTTKSVINDYDTLIGVATEKKAKFESGQISDWSGISTHSDDIANIVGTGLAQAKRSELLSKIDAEQQIQRSTNRCIDMDAEHGSLTTRRDQLASLANSEFKSTEKYIDVIAGSTSTIKDQYIADRSKIATSKILDPLVDVESGLTKSRATAFENPDETTVKRTVEIGNEALERGVAKERVAMFTNLESGAQLSTKRLSIDANSNSKIRVDENGNVARESDKREEIYFEKGQTKQLVEQWKTKQISPEKDTPDAQVVQDTEITQNGKAKNLVEMFKTMDKENTPPSERRGLRTMTPPSNNERRVSFPENDEFNSQKSVFTEDKINIESGHAKAVRERLLQNAEQNNNTSNTKKTFKQITPPPQSSDIIRRKSTTPTNDNSDIIEQYTNNEEILPMKGQAKSLKNRFVELEQDALKVETASSKIKYVPKRFVDKPAPKQNNVEPTVDSTKCTGCNKPVYAMEKIEADNKIYHKSCFK